ncbi:hypothetical protein MIC448_920053 [Microbacterium sp. C448]|nr:hypothetical protein MIC448_920053 [Microbacterium sp. C448]
MSVVGRRVSNMHSICHNVETTGVDAIARELAGEGTDAWRANARTEAAMARVFAKAAHVGARRAAELASPCRREGRSPRTVPGARRLSISTDACYAESPRGDDGDVYPSRPSHRNQTKRRMGFRSRRRPAGAGR